MTLQESFNSIKKSLPPHVTLAAVSKTHPAEKVAELYSLGQRIFAENKAQELAEKQALLPRDIEWHLIGHLQTNKVKMIIPFIHTIQSVDSERLLKEIDRVAAAHSRTVEVYLQIKIAEEETKSGLSSEAAELLFRQWVCGDFPNVVVTGLMGMATFTGDEDQLQREFSSLKALYDRLSAIHPLKHLSMGMSGDYLTAVDCGANLVRVGSAIFGQR